MKRYCFMGKNEVGLKIMGKSTLPERPLGFWSSVAIGIGGMVGGGIFAVLGLAIQFAHGGTPIAFLLAGMIALVSSYSYAHLSITFPSQGGTVEFLNQGFRVGVIPGGLNILLWLSYIIMLSLYSYAFGSYGASFFPVHTQIVWKHIFISAIIILLTILNIIGAKAVGRVEQWIVGLKIIILIVFISVGFWSIHFQQLAPTAWSPPLHLIVGGMVIFLAYEGFELIANAAKDVENPQKTLPRAFYSAVIFVILLYILISMVTLGNLSLLEISASRDYVLAASAKPFLGYFGFVLIGIAALLSTGSAINATLYGASRISYIIAKEGELPETLEKKIWNRPIEGLLLTSGLTLLVANLFDLTSISLMGSSGFLLIFAMVNLVNVRLYKKTESYRWISLLGFIGCIGALSALIWETILTTPYNLIALVVIVALSFIIEIIYRRVSGKILKRPRS